MIGSSVKLKSLATITSPTSWRRRKPERFYASDVTRSMQRCKTDESEARVGQKFLIPNDALREFLDRDAEHPRAGIPVKGTTQHGVSQATTR